MDITSYILGMKAGSGSSNMHYVVVEELPTTGEEGYIYLVPKATSGTNNYYDEYMYINEDWEKIGDTEIDLSDYQHTMQYAVVPNATADNLGKIIQYTGTTDSTYTNGYYYKCVQDGSTYKWENIQVQAGGGSEDKTIIIEDNPRWDSQMEVNTTANREAVQPLLDDFNNINKYNIIHKRSVNNGTPYYNHLINAYQNLGIIWLVFLRNGISQTSINGVSVRLTEIYTITVDSSSISGTKASEYVLVSNSDIASKNYIDNKPTTYTGYDATKTQVLKNINGTLTWVDEA